MDDLISRQAAIDAIAQCTNCGDEDTLREYVLKHGLDNGWTGGILEALDAVKDLPPVQPERKKGEWLPDNNNAYEIRFVCSCCKESEVVPTIGFTKYKPLCDFCPNCGADMRGEKDG